AANGDTANKIGTYSLAVLAAHHKVPFYVAAPFSTIDPALASGAEIPIEERDPAEVRRGGAPQAAPPAPPGVNPAPDAAPPTLAALAAPASAAASLGLSQLAAVLYYAAGVTKKKTYPGGGEVLFRAAASTGALYQTEVYVAVGEVAGLEPGLYHFCPGDFALRGLRKRDVRAALAAAAAAAPAGGSLDSIDHATLPLSSSEVDYPLVREMHAASSLATTAAVAAWREGAWRDTTPPERANLIALPPPRERAGRGLGETIQRRGSTRE